MKLPVPTSPTPNETRGIERLTSQNMELPVLAPLSSQGTDRLTYRIIEPEKLPYDSSRINATENQNRPEEITCRVG